MITLYKLISEKELLELGGTLFKSFVPGLPLTFDVNIQQDNHLKDPGMFLIQCEIEEHEISSFKTLNTGELRVETDKVPLFNTLIADKIKILDFFGNTEDLTEESLEVLEKEERFFKTRLDIFLETNNRTMIPYDYLDQSDCTDSTEKEIEQSIKEIAEEQKIFARIAKEKTSNINTVEEAAYFLIHEDLDEKQIRQIKNKSIVTQFKRGYDHFGLGMYLRSLFIYPNENKIFLDHLKNYDAHYVIDRGEHGEGIIADLVWRILNDRQTTAENQKEIIENQKAAAKLWEEFYNKKNTENLSPDAQYDLMDEFVTLIKGGSLKKTPSRDSRLLSYNFEDKIMDQYLELDTKKQADKEHYMEYVYRQKVILAELSENELLIYDQLWKDYSTIENLVSKIEQKL